MYVYVYKCYIHILCIIINWIKGILNLKDIFLACKERSRLSARCVIMNFYFDLNFVFFIVSSFERTIISVLTRTLILLLFCMA